MAQQEMLAGCPSVILNRRSVYAYPVLDWVKIPAAIQTKEHNSNCEPNAQSGPIWTSHGFADLSCALWLNLVVNYGIYEPYGLNS